MKRVQVRDAAVHLPVRGYNLLKGVDVDRLSAYLRTLMPDMLDWSYGFKQGELTVRAVDGTVVPVELWDFGTVEVITNAG